MSRILIPKRPLVAPRRQRGFFGPAPLIRPFAVDGAEFDGSNDELQRGAALTGIADASSAIFSAWCRVDGAGTQTFLSSDPSRASILITSARLLFRAFDTNGSIVASLQSDLAVLSASASWRHVLAAWDLPTDAASIYIGDSEALSSKTLDTDGEAAFSDSTDWKVGGSLVASDAKFDGGLAEIYFAPGQYLDFSVEANRRKFISASGKPVFLGIDGSRPTGTKPSIYLSLRKGGAASEFAANRAAGGAFSVTGSLGVTSTSPSD